MKSSHDEANNQYFDSKDNTESQQLDLHNETTKLKTEEEKIVDYLPPDGGWGWLVCFGCFLTTVSRPKL